MNDIESVQLSQSYLNALTQGDAAKAAEAVSKALAEGLSPSRVYTKILLPALMEVGSLWHSGKLNVAEERLATHIGLHEMTRVKQLIKPKSALGTRAVIASLDGDQHFIGARAVADFLYMDGWDVDFLGSSLPSADLLKFISERKVDLLGISVNMPSVIPELGRVLQEARRSQQTLKIILGGSAVKNVEPAQIQALGADGIAADAIQAVALARKICGLAEAKASLNQYLKGLGERILQKRKARNYTQQELAGLADLDRAYISSVEHGKQNMTIGAIYKLSEALEIPLEELLVGSPN